jgi:hypothetical protein
MVEVCDESAGFEGSSVIAIAVFFIDRRRSIFANFTLLSSTNQ